MKATDYLELAGAVVVVLGAVWSILRFIFSPRIEAAVAQGLNPVVDRVEKLERRASHTDTRIDGIEGGQQRAERAIEKIGSEIKEGLDGLSSAIDGLSKAHESTAREVAFMRGAMQKPARARKKAG